MFWFWFNGEAAPKLALREVSFRKIFNYLDTVDASQPLVIVETGCLRTPDNWAGDGQSTLMFDRYLQDRSAGGICYAMDIDPVATAACRSLVGPRTEVLTGDSVIVLRDVAERLRASRQKISLLYLDSFDLDWNNVTPSAVHHLKELVSIYEFVTPQTLVVVDDAPVHAVCSTNAEGSLVLLGEPVVNGKGKFVAEYAAQVGAKRFFSHYQCAWIGFR
ncbi:MAG: hypothetical protein FJ184_14570 [Gammaproteobacteria bacterium]|nr:hypothetical protein [Gammaproteobacteria bacterium]MBM4234413.1 hypothetical protein [Gammaproteobacteria bacterium]